MDLRNRTVLLLGGWGLVGNAIARALVEEAPHAIVIHSLRETEARDAVASLGHRYGQSGVSFLPAWGNIFVRNSLKDRPREELLADRTTRHTIIDDTMLELSRDILEQAYLYRLFLDHKPNVVIDCINTATAFAYQDVFYSVRRVQDVVARVDAGQAGAQELSDVIENHLTTLSLPQLIRHVQVIRAALRDADTSVYLKVGTTGSGGMGLNIPYTHSEEKPSRVLLSKSSIAGAHSMLLYLLARTPDAPNVKEIKPSAAIAWKEIGAGPVQRGGRPIDLFDCSMENAMPIGEAIAEHADGWTPLRDESGDPVVLESVFIDTGENGVFSSAEFETVTALGQMEFVTPEEIAADVIREIKGGSTGREIVSALDGSTLGPSYRAGVMRHRALEEMRALEEEHGLESVAFEMLGPPRLSKLLYEAALLRRVCGSLEAVAAGDAKKMSAACTDIVERDMELRARILSIGLAIRLPDGRLLRGPEMKIPVYADEARAAVSPESIERWARAGWVDLGEANMVVWRERASRILGELEKHPAEATSSELFEDRTYWGGDDLPIGRVAAWVLGVEEEGTRGKAV